MTFLFFLLAGKSVFMSNSSSESPLWLMREERIATTSCEQVKQAVGLRVKIIVCVNVGTRVFELGSIEIYQSSEIVF